MSGGYMPESKSQRHLTPELIIDAVHTFFGGPPDLDPFAAPLQFWKDAGCTHDLINARVNYLLPHNDGLVDPYFGNVYANPPYALETLTEAAVRLRQHRDQGEVVALLPAHKTEKSFWQVSVLMAAAQVCFVSGRLKYLGDKHQAPFPSAVIFWGPAVRVPAFNEAFGHVGGMMR
jgi:hypothetical protein